MLVKGVLKHLAQVRTQAYRRRRAHKVHIVAVQGHIQGRQHQGCQAEQRTEPGQRRNGHRLCRIVTGRYRGNGAGAVKIFQRVVVLVLIVEIKLLQRVILTIIPAAIVAGMIIIGDLLDQINLGVIKHTHTGEHHHHKGDHKQGAPFVLHQYARLGFNLLAVQFHKKCLSLLLRIPACSQ